MLSNCCLMNPDSTAFAPVNWEAFKAAPIRNSFLNASLSVGSAKTDPVTPSSAQVVRNSDFIFIAFLSEPRLRRSMTALSQFVRHLNGGLFVELIGAKQDGADDKHQA